MRKVPFFMREAFRALRRNAAPSVAAIVTIVVTTLLLGVLIPVLKASASKNDQVRSQLSLRVFLNVDATKPQIDAAGKKLRGVPHVSRVQYVSKADALRILRGRLSNTPGGLNDSLQSLKGNPLPPGFNVFPDNADNLEAITRAIIPPGPDGKGRPISPAIHDIANASQSSDAIRSATSKVKIMLVLLASLLLAASVMLVANTIRLSIYARRREIEVMTLVGATKWFVRWPFVIEGAVVALLGSGMAIAILWVVKTIVADPLANSPFLSNVSTVGFGPLVLTLIGAAMAVSALGSGVTLRRFLRV